MLNFELFCADQTYTVKSAFSAQYTRILFLLFRIHLSKTYDLHNVLLADVNK